MKEKSDNMLEANINIKENLRKINLNLLFKIITIIITLLIIIFIIYAVKLGILQDKTILTTKIKHLGIYGPIIFILLQIIQVVFPIIPGGFSCIAGVLAFGSIQGFIYNYIGVIIGSCVAYFLAKHYGINLLKKLFKDKTINKYLNNNIKFQKLFQIGIFMPCLPDDLLCYIAGINKINFKTFFITILLGKPVTLLIYSIFLNFI